MERVSHYDIPFVGLPLGSHKFEYVINKKFFDLFEIEQEFSDCELRVDIQLDKKSSFMEVFYTLEGFVVVPDDVTGEDFPLKIKNSWKQIVKFGDSYDDSDDEVLIIPHTESTLALAQFLYEGILTAIPIKKVNPENKNSEHYKELKDILKKLAPKEEKKEQEENPIWEKLKELKNKN